MNTNPGTVTVWQSGRLAPRAGGRRSTLAGVTRAQWLGAALLVLSALVLAAFVALLEQEVARSEMQHLAQRSPAGEQPGRPADAADMPLVAGR